MWLRILVYFHIHDPDSFNTFKHEVVNHNDVETFISSPGKHTTSPLQRPVF